MLIMMITAAELAHQRQELAGFCTRSHVANKQTLHSASISANTTVHVNRRPPSNTSWTTVLPIRSCWLQWSLDATNSRLPTKHRTFVHSQRSLCLQTVDNSRTSWLLSRQSDVTGCAHWVLTFTVLCSLICCHPSETLHYMASGMRSSSLYMLADSSNARTKQKGYIPFAFVMPQS